MKGSELMKVKETAAKTVLVRSKLPDAEYVVNPYTGCELGCQYCYASFTGRSRQRANQQLGPLCLCEGQRGVRVQGYFVTGGRSTSTPQSGVLRV